MDEKKRRRRRPGDPDERSQAGAPPRPWQEDPPPVLPGQMTWDARLTEEDLRGVADAALGRTPPAGDPLGTEDPLETAVRVAAALEGAEETGGPEEDGPPIGEKEIAEAAEILTRYKQGKANLEARIVEDELWWELRHWEAIRRNTGERQVLEPTSAWLFNTLMNKHADAMDNMPEPVILPREQSDEASAKILCDVVPVVLEYNHYDSTIDGAWWEKLKHGTACFGVFWDPKRDNGLGDIDVQQIDLLKIFWEPGVTDIQKSRNLFIVDLVDEDLLDQTYPEYAGQLGGHTIDVKQYIFDESIDTSNKSLVVDWYYKREDAGGRTVLHYAKFVGKTLLYASENEPGMENGFYEDGQYPVVMDTLFPEKGTPVGFGYIAVCKDPQMYIDKVYGQLLRYVDRASKPRAWVSSQTNVNEEEYLDWDQPLIHVEGSLDDRGFRDVNMPSMPNGVIDVIQMKIDEMKETAANRDANAGSASSGVTAAAAIAALQEAGNKVSRDMISGHYRAFALIVEMVIERMRQFYTEKRAFRIVGPNGSDAVFLDVDNSGLRDQPMGTLPGQTEMLWRRPVFDVRAKAQKRSPFSRMEQNERAKELFSMGFFNPDMAQQAMGALEMMEFEQIEDVRDYVAQGQTLNNLVQQLTATVQQLQAALGMAAAPAEGAPAEGGGGAGGGGGSVGGDIVDADKKNMTAYMQRLAERSTPNMNIGSDAATPGGGA